MINAKQSLKGSVSAKTQKLKGTVVLGKPNATVEVFEVEGGHKVKVTDPNGVQELVIKDGIDGIDGVDGKDGYTPVKGKDYFDGIDGKDGYTPVKGKDYFDGEKGDKGDRGDAGYTPIKGVDYFDGQKGDKGDTGEVTWLYASNNFVNALKETASGNPICLTDVSPLEHDLKIKVDGATKVSRYGKNLFDKSKSARQTRLEEDGNLIEFSTMQTSDFIGIVPNTTYSLTETGSHRGKFYDSEKRPISSGYDFGEFGASCTFTVPENAHYLMFSYFSSYEEGIQLEVGETVTEYEPHKEVQTAEVVDGTVTGLTSVSPNMTLIADAGTIEVEYNRDLNKALNEGGNIEEHTKNTEVHITSEERAKWNGKLDQTKLPEAVNEALAQAKASGQFDGKDGTSPTVSVTAIEGGNRVSITDVAGTKSFDVMNGKDGAGGSGTNTEVSWNDLKDKPFYSYALNEVVYSETVTLSTGSHKAYTDGVPFEIVKGETYKVTIEGETYECEGETHTVVMDAGSLIYTYIGNLSLVNGVEGASNTEEPFGFASLSVGGSTVFVLYTTYPSMSTISVEVQHLEKTYSPLSHIYLPDGVPYLIAGTIPILEDCVPVFDEDGMGYITEPVTLEVGKVYSVTFNGTEYECVAFEVKDDSMTASVIGNGEMFGLTGNNEPFVVASVMGMTMLIALDGSTEVTISISEKVVHERKLPTELLPETVATKDYVNKAIANIVNGNGVEY